MEENLSPTPTMKPQGPGTISERWGGVGPSQPPSWQPPDNPPDDTGDPLATPAVVNTIQAFEHVLGVRTCFGCSNMILVFGHVPDVRKMFPVFRRKKCVTRVQHHMLARTCSITQKMLETAGIYSNTQIMFQSIFIHLFSCNFYSSCSPHVSGTSVPTYSPLEGLS